MPVYEISYAVGKYVSSVIVDGDTATQAEQRARDSGLIPKGAEIKTEERTPH